MKEIVEVKPTVLPKLGFLGVGWIGKNRLEALSNANLCDGIVICDTYEPSITETLRSVPSAIVKNSFDDLLNEDIDGIVIATPSAQHAKQSIKALEAGKAVFCQKPLGRNLNETIEVVRAAQKADKLLGVDYSYRFTNGIQALKKLIAERKLGKIYKVEAVFHNAYGPDKSWFYDPTLSGGGCLIDLGTHLIDLMMFLFNSPSLEVRYANILTQGKPIINREEQVEDYAEAHISSATGVNMRIACSWKLAVGKDADIYVKVFGTEGGASFHNVNGSFYDFQTDVFHQNKKETIVIPPDDWGGKAIQDWAENLSKKNIFSSTNHELIKSASLLEEIYHYNR